MKILTIGGTTQDIIAEYSANQEVVFPWQEGSKIELKKLHYTTGGGATNSAVSFKKLGHDVACLLTIGDDTQGQEIIKDLNSYQLTLATLIHKNHKTGVSFIIPTEHKDRIIFSCHGANEQLTTTDVSNELISTHDTLYISSLHGASANTLPYIIHSARSHMQTNSKYKIAVNPGGSQLHQEFPSLKASLHGIDIFISNKEEMKLIMAGLKNHNFLSSGKGLIPDGPSLTRSIQASNKVSFTLYEYFFELFSYGIKIIVLTDGKNGVYVAIKDRLYFHPSIKVPLINTLGAGDAFGSTFVGLLALGYTLEYALKGGVLNAASVIQHIGAKAGLLTFKELNSKIKTLDSKLLQKFSL